MAASISCSRSRLSTGLPSPLRQPFFFQPGIHFVTQLITYWLSQRISRSSPARSVARNSSSTARSSPWLLVACFQPPAAQLSSSTYHAQPAGPGLPSAEPSADAVIVMQELLGSSGSIVLSAGDVPCSLSSRLLLLRAIDPRVLHRSARASYRLLRTSEHGSMKPTTYDDAKLHPLTTDALIEERVAELLGRAIRRQLWLLFLDEHDVQMPLLVPLDGLPQLPPDPPDPALRSMLQHCAETAGAHSFIFVLERYADATLTPADIAWVRALHSACDEAQVPLR